MAKNRRARNWWVGYWSARKSAKRRRKGNFTYLGRRYWTASGKRVGRR